MKVFSGGVIRGSRGRKKFLSPGQAFSIIEVLVGVATIGIVFVTLYTGFSSGFMMIQLARENLRATQILQEKMETIRLYSWEQVNAEDFIPPTFEAPFYALETDGDDAEEGLTYYGTVQVSPTTLTESYSTNMRLVKITLTWDSGRLQRTRVVQTFVSRYGLQNYIY